MTRLAYYDRDADIVWIPFGESDDVVSQRVPGGLRDHDRATRLLVAVEVWDASTRLPADLLDVLPGPDDPVFRGVCIAEMNARFTGFPPLRADDDIVPVRARPID